MTKNKAVKKEKKSIQMPNTMMLDGELVDIKNHNEQWSEFTLEDGAMIRLKAIAIDIRKVKGRYNPNGDPIYLIKSTVITDAKIPDNLKKKE